MKLSIHEKILLGVSVLFSVFTFKTASGDVPHTTDAKAPSALAAPYYVDINSASYEELITLDGIGPSTANRIVEFRKKHGNFKSVNELCNVSGIGKGTLEKIKNYIKV